MKFVNTLQFAKEMDRKDPLRSYRKLFHLPRINNKPCVYFTGNSLGLQPVGTKKIVNEELEDWAHLGVEGHFHARRPWLNYHQFSRAILADIVGAKKSEVVPMNQLTINLHLMMTTFYRPDKKRFRIIMEAGAFSSDQYAIESQLALHGLTAEDALIEIKPREGEYTLRTEDIIATLQSYDNTVALVLFGAVQYYTGQFFDVAAITKAGHRAGAFVGFDLAHAIGNVPLKLHKDNVDFAVWCGYKYLNSGPGSIAGAFIHDRHGKNLTLPRLAGWWGHKAEERFQMKKGFQPMNGAEGWQVSNFPVLSGAAQLASLELFKSAGMKALREKSELLTGYLEFLLQQKGSAQFTIITPATKKDRGCQLSVLMHKNGKKVFKALERAGIIADWREPDVIRVAPVPLYNSFSDVYRMAETFIKALTLK